MAFSHGINSSCFNILAYTAATIFSGSNMEGESDPFCRYYSENETGAVEHCAVCWEEACLLWSRVGGKEWPVFTVEVVRLFNCLIDCLLIQR